MPELSRFFGIVIKMFYDDHNPPHFHAFYGDHVVLMEIESMSVFAGSLPPRVLGFLVEWASLHKSELKANWERAQNQLPMERIAPL